jgi:predicted restriction endonuclease
MDYWEGRCAITGLAVPELLRASHIKPWSACETDAERLDVFNGILLAPHFDAVFDLGFITLNERGEVVVSPLLSAEARRVLCLEVPIRVDRLAQGHQRYLAQHRVLVFRNAGTKMA